MSRRTPNDVRVSEERIAGLPSGVEICYQTFGDPEDETILLVMGLGGPMTWWDPELCRRLARARFHVVRFDNRDTGRSSRMAGRVRRRDLVRAYLGLPVRAPYTLDDMAEDGFGLLDHLGVDAAHLVGVSMGGMIAQTMTLARPDRARSLTSIMSSTGRRTVGWQHPSLLPALLQRSRNDKETYVTYAVWFWQLIGSPDYPDAEEVIRKRAEETWDRGVSPQGVMRQMLAVLLQPNRTRSLRSLQVPTLVVHGLADRMVHVSGGRSTAAAVPGSELLLIPGMGHNLPLDLHESLAEAITRTARRA